MTTIWDEMDRYEAKTAKFYKRVSDADICGEAGA